MTPDEERSRLTDIERHLNTSDPALADALSHAVPPPRQPTRWKITMDEAVAIGLAFIWVAAVLNHRGVLALGLTVLWAGILLARRASRGDL